MTGFLGNDWCPNDYDDEFLEKMWDQAVENEDEKMLYLLNLQLFDGFGPDGRRIGSANRVRKPPSLMRFGSLWDEFFPEDLWDDDDD